MPSVACPPSEAKVDLDLSPYDPKINQNLLIINNSHVKFESDCSLYCAQQGKTRQTHTLTHPTAHINSSPPTLLQGDKE